MATAIEIAREYFPDATEDFLDFALWNKTGFPEFWRIPQDGKTPEACLRKQLRKFKYQLDNGKKGCELCGRTLPATYKLATCKRCREALAGEQGRDRY